MYRHPELRPLSRGHQPLLVHARDLGWRATYIERGDTHLATAAWPTFRSWARLALEAHLTAEETHLLPRLAACDEPEMRAALDEDARLRTALRAVVTSVLATDTEGGADETPETLRAVADALRGHARHCERVLFPLAQDLLGDAGPGGLDGLADALGVYEI